MLKTFGELANGQVADLYTISCGRIRADITNYGATLVSLFVDDVDVVLGFEDVSGYATQGGYLGAVVGRNANRVGGAKFLLNGEEVLLPANEGPNCLHSGADGWSFRLWQVKEHTASSLTLCMNSPDGDQGFPGNAQILVTYALEADATLSITYDAVCDQDTVFNLTNHSYFHKTKTPFNIIIII